MFIAVTQESQPQYNHSFFPLKGFNQGCNMIRLVACYSVRLKALNVFGGYGCSWCQMVVVGDESWFELYRNH